MTAAAQRNKLSDYIKVADDRKIKAIYTMLEREIEDASPEWWHNEGFVDKLNAEYTDWKEGKVKGFSTQEIVDFFESKRARRTEK